MSKEACINYKYEMANYIITNKCTYTQAAEHFGKTYFAFKKHLNYIKENDKDLYDLVEKSAKEALSEFRKHQADRALNEKTLEVANYIIENNISIEKVAEHFKVHKRTIMNYLNRLVDDNYELYSKAIDTLNKAILSGKKDVKHKGKLLGQGKNSYSYANDINNQEEIFNYALQTTATINEIAFKFNISRNTVNRTILALKERDYEKYKVLKEKVLDANMNHVHEIKEYAGSCLELDEKEKDAIETSRRMLWFKQNLKPGDIVKYGASDECSRKVVVGEKYNNFFRTNEGKCLYYQNCRKILVK